MSFTKEQLHTTNSIIVGIFNNTNKITTENTFELVKTIQMYFGLSKEDSLELVNVSIQSILPKEQRIKDSFVFVKGFYNTLKIVNGTVNREQVVIATIHKFYLTPKEANDVYDKLLEFELIK